MTNEERELRKADAMKPGYSRNLIFDIGLHKGYDTSFYLAKGFDVVGLEARADLCEVVASEQQDAVNSGRLRIVNKALYSESGKEVQFFVNPDKDDWGSLSRGVSEKGIGVSFEIRVKTVTLGELFEECGIPYYIKCDIEGADQILVEQLVGQTYRPPFVSIEVNGIEDVARLFAGGYDAFQIVNQQFNWVTRPPEPAREGAFVSQRFSGEMSGLFGFELAAEGWTDFSTAVNHIVFWMELSAKNKRLSEGWLDIHCTTREFLARGSR